MLNRIIIILFFALAHHASLLAQITIINPSNTETINSDLLNFKWAQGIVGDYEILISQNATLTPIYSRDTVFNALALPKSGFLPGDYYWQMRSISPTISNWSSVRSFTIINITSFASISLWLKPESGILVTASNKVYSWQNQTSNNHAVQTIASAQPNKIDPGIDGHAIVSFDGVDDNLEFGTINDIREAFIVCKHNTGSQNYAPVLGDANVQPDFHGGVGNKLLIPAFTNPKIVNGVVRTNGTAQTVAGILKPTAFSVISISSTDSVQANTIARDRGFTVRSWNGSYAEVLLLNDSVSLAQKIKIENYLKWKYSPFPFIGNDKVVCGESIKIGFGPDHAYSSILWSNSQTNIDSITITQNGTYWVQVQSFGMTFRDTIIISGIIPKPTISLNSNALICYGDSIMVSHNPIPGYTATWSNGNTGAVSYYKDSTQTIQLTHVDANNCVASSNAYLLTVDSFALESTLGPDRNACLGTNISVETTAPGPFAYAWSTGDTSSSTTPQSLGIQDIFVQVNNSNNCIFKDTVEITALNLQGPIVNFSTDSVCLKTQTSFTDLSFSGGLDNIISWKWKFTPLDSSFAQNPQHAYQLSNASATLTVETDSGCANSVTKNVFNHKLPKAVFQGFVVCKDQTIQITNNSTVFNPDIITSYEWTTSQQTISGSSPILSFSNEGMEEVQLIVLTDKSCRDTVSKMIEVFPALVPNFSFSNVCIGDTVQFTDNTASFSIIERVWDFDFFNQSSIEKNPKFYYPSIGSYEVQLSLTNAIGCKSDTIQTIEIRELPIALPNIENKCVGSDVLFYDASTLGLGSLSQQQWEINGQSYNSDSLNMLFSAAGTYPIYYEIQDNFSCKDDTSFLFEINALPVVDFDFNPNYGTAPIDVSFTNLSQGAIAYFWSFGENNSGSLDENPTYTYTQNGIYNITLVASNLYGCSDSLSREIPIIPTELDVELSSLSIQKTTLSDGSIRYTPRVLVKNVGSRAITTIDLLASIDSESKVAETWEGLLTIGQAFVYEFSSFFIVPNSDLVDYLCVEAANVNDNTEINFSNNKVCEIQNGLIQSSNLYPNPTQETVFMDVITTKQGQLKLDLYDLLGRTIFADKTISVQKGYNQISIDCRSLQAGEYLVRMIYQDEVYSQALIITNK